MMTVYFGSIFLFFAVIASGITIIINLVNLTINLPFLSDTKISAFIADMIGFDNTKRDRIRLMDELSDTENQIKGIEEKMERLKRIIDENQEKT